MQCHQPSETADEINVSMTKLYTFIDEWIDELMSWPIEYGIIWLYSGVAQYNIAAVVKCIDFGWIFKILTELWITPKIQIQGKEGD